MPRAGFLEGLDAVMRAARRQLRLRLRTRQVLAAHSEAIAELLEAQKEVASVMAVERRLVAHRLPEAELERQHARVDGARQGLARVLERLAVAKLALRTLEAEERRSEARDSLAALERYLALAHARLSFIRERSRLPASLLEQKLNGLLLQANRDLEEAKKATATSIAYEKRLAKMHDLERKALASAPREGDVEALAHRRDHEERARWFRERWVAEKDATDQLKTSLRDLHGLMLAATREKDTAILRQRYDEATLAIAAARGALDAAPARGRKLDVVARRLEAAHVAVVSSVESASQRAQRREVEVASAAEWGLRAVQALSLGNDELCKEALARQRACRDAGELLESRHEEWLCVRNGLCEAVQAVSDLVRHVDGQMGASRELIERIDAIINDLNVQLGS